LRQTVGNNVVAVGGADQNVVIRQCREVVITGHCNIPGAVFQTGLDSHVSASNAILTELDVCVPGSAALRTGRALLLTRCSSTGLHPRPTSNNVTDRGQAGVTCELSQTLTHYPAGHSVSTSNALGEELVGVDVWVGGASTDYLPAHTCRETKSGVEVRITILHDTLGRLSCRALYADFIDLALVDRAVDAICAANHLRRLPKTGHTEGTNSAEITDTSESRGSADGERIRISTAPGARVDFRTVGHGVAHTFVTGQ
jgi:hypothetical protein